LLPEYGFLYYLTDSNVDAFELSVSKKVSGNQLWHQVYRYPEIGFSGFYTSLGNDAVFGRAFALNPYINFNLTKDSPLSLKYKIGLGLGYITKHFDPETNYRDLPVGSHLNIWFVSELYGVYTIRELYSVRAGISFYHLSNANLAEPNIGLNYLTFFLGSAYRFRDNKSFEIKEIRRFIKKTEYSIGIGGSVKKTRRFAPETYFAGSISFEVKRYLGYKFGIGVGTDLFFDSSVPDELVLSGIPDPKLSCQIKTGIHISQELVVGKLSLIVHEGIYIGFTDQLEHKKLYNRGIVRYHFADHWFASLSMKSNLFVLDVMELGLGYKVKSKK
jgi:hypothetical protein